MTSEDPATPDEFARLLAWAYRGEVSGEALFSALADAWAKSEHGDALSVLADLERRMALALTPLLDRYEVDGGDDERGRRKGRDSAAAIADLAWGDFLTQFAPVTDEALVRYHRLRSIAPDRDPVYDELIAHEEALQAFSAAEMRGDHDGALDPVHTVVARLSVSH